MSKTRKIEPYVDVAFLLAFAMLFVVHKINGS
jgi:hypothetical protein